VSIRYAIVHVPSGYEVRDEEGNPLTVVRDPVEAFRIAETFEIIARLGEAHEAGIGRGK